MSIFRLSIAVVALAASSLCWAPSTIAFEVGGLVSGVSLAEVESFAKAQGWTFEHGPEDAPSDYHLLKPGSASAVVQFCEEHLYSVSAQVPDGFKGFVALVEDLTKSQGSPTVSADTSPDGFEPVIATVMFSWTHEGGERSLISYGAADDLSREGLQMSPNAVFLFDYAMAVCGHH